MSGKIAYSTFSDNLWSIYKSAFGKVNEQTFMDHWDKGVRAIAKTQYKDVGGDYMADVFAQLRHCLVFAWKFRPIEHYFLAPGLRQFLVSAVQTTSVDYCRKLPTAILAPSEYPKIDDSVKFSPGPVLTPEQKERIQTSITESKTPRAFAIHFPSKESTRSILVWPDAYLWNESESAHMLWFFAATDGHGFVTAIPDCEDYGDATDLVKIIYGFSLYVEAFPETVVQARVENVHKLNRYHGHSRVVQCNRVVRLENEGAAISPHFRRGHFRVLHSDRFTKKQGQVVFVKGCFVKGKAYEVLSDEPSTEQKEAA